MQSRLYVLNFFTELAWQVFRKQDGAGRQRFVKTYLNLTDISIRPL